jgi:hypothetical protein
VQRLLLKNLAKAAKVAPKAAKVTSKVRTVDKVSSSEIFAKAAKVALKAAKVEGRGCF